MKLYEDAARAAEALGSASSDGLGNVLCSTMCPFGEYGHDKSPEQVELVQFAQGLCE